MITLLDHFVWNGAAASSLVTPWTRFPDGMKNADIWIDTKLTDGSTNLGIELQSSVDQTTTEAVTSGLTAAATTGPAVTAISSKLGPYVRLRLFTTSIQANTMVSVWLIPKND